MLKYVHYHSKFEKRLNALKKSEKMAVSAAKKAEEIINNILNHGEFPLSILGKFSRHGEARIKNCIKFDIGKGYRLVGVKNNEHLFLLYIGSHDDCATWIENNRNLTIDEDSRNLVTCVTLTADGREHLYNRDTQEEADYEEMLLQRITEKDLQFVFRGLAGLEGCQGDDKMKI
jgi:mRNA-degrading endonuclease YafQ of YafQ-DinJ toxin-antitoxin module